MSNLPDDLVTSQLTPDQRALFYQTAPGPYEYAELLAQGYEPDTSMHFQGASDEDLAEAKRLLKTGKVSRRDR